MDRGKYEFLNQSGQKSKLWPIVGWGLYTAFGLLSTFIVLIAASGFWPTFAWIALLVAAPRLWKFR